MLTIIKLPMDRKYPEVIADERNTHFWMKILPITQT